MTLNRTAIFGAVCLAVIITTFAGFIPVTADASNATQKAKAQVLIDQAVITVDEFMQDPSMEWLKKNMSDARGLLIVPDLLKAGFLWGGSGGNGILMVRNETTGEWGQPAFYSMGSVSFGLQIGANTSQVIIMVRSQRGVEKLYTSSVKLGGDVSVAVGPLGGGAGAATNIVTDFVSLSRAQGAFAGLSLEGSVIKTNDEMNAHYYGQPVSTIDIVVKQAVSDIGAEKLRTVLSNATKGK